MIDWNALLQALVTSSLVAATVAAVLNFAFNRRLKQFEAQLSRQLKKFEAELQVSTALRIGFDEERREDYRKLAGAVRSIRRHVVDLCEMPARTADDVSKAGSEVKDLQSMIYGLSITLEADRIYKRIHGYKV